MGQGTGHSRGQVAHRQEMPGLLLLPVCVEGQVAYLPLLHLRVGPASRVGLRRRGYGFPLSQE